MKTPLSQRPQQRVSAEPLHAPVTYRPYAADVAYAQTQSQAENSSAGAVLREMTRLGCRLQRHCQVQGLMPAEVLRHNAPAGTLPVTPTPPQDLARLAQDLARLTATQQELRDCLPATLALLSDSYTRLLTLLALSLRYSWAAHLQQPGVTPEQVQAHLNRALAEADQHSRASLRQLEDFAQLPERLRFSRQLE